MRGRIHISAGYMVEGALGTLSAFQPFKKKDIYKGGLGRSNPLDYIYRDRLLRNYFRIRFFFKKNVSSTLYYEIHWPTEAIYYACIADGRWRSL
jgi:hypothetical protein